MDIRIGHVEITRIPWGQKEQPKWNRRDVLEKIRMMGYGHTLQARYAAARWLLLNGFGGGENV